MTWLHGPLLDSISIAGGRQIPLINYGRKGGERLSNWAMSKNRGWLIYVYGLYSLHTRESVQLVSSALRSKLPKELIYVRDFFESVPLLMLVIYEKT